jgi:hypothetical protein
MDTKNNDVGENTTVYQVTGQKCTEPERPHITKEWFYKTELGKEWRTLKYEVDGERKKVAFLFLTKSKKEMRLLAAKCRTRKTDVGVYILDEDKYNFETVLETVRYGPNEEKMTREDLEALEAEKASGIYDTLVLYSLQASKQTPDDIESEKN